MKQYIDILLGIVDAVRNKDIVTSILIAVQKANEDGLALSLYELTTILTAAHGIEMVEEIGLHTHYCLALAQGADDCELDGFHNSGEIIPMQFNDGLTDTTVFVLKSLLNDSNVFFINETGSKMKTYILDKREDDFYEEESVVTNTGHLVELSS